MAPIPGMGWMAGFVRTTVQSAGESAAPSGSAVPGAPGGKPAGFAPAVPGAAAAYLVYGLAVH